MAKNIRRILEDHGEGYNFIKVGEERARRRRCSMTASPAAAVGCRSTKV
ncbi:hypothetical protein [Thermacetogenium phaeum]|nr:hypothetical protein [Thermacetogenium phaeum]